MSGLSHLENRVRGPRRHNSQSVKVEEKRLQKLLDFIDTRMQAQRSKLRRQIEDTQNTADEMEEKRHQATLNVLKNYFEVTSGRLRNSKYNQMHEERMTGVLSEPSLATVPEIDAEILAKPRSMYDRITRSLDTSRLPLIAPKNKNLVNQQQSKSLPPSLPTSVRSDDSYAENGLTPNASPPSTPRNASTPSDSTGETSYVGEPKKTHIRKTYSGAKNGFSEHGYHASSTKTHQQSRNGYKHEDNNNNYDTLNGHMYQKGAQKPSSKLSIFLENSEPPTPRLSDVVASKNGLSRHSSLKRPIKSSMAMSMTSLTDLQPSRKQQAANKLKYALKGNNSFRLQR